jgi:hypothetical protein
MEPSGGNYLGRSQTGEDPLERQEPEAEGKDAGAEGLEPVGPEEAGLLEWLAGPRHQPYPEYH